MLTAAGSVMATAMQRATRFRVWWGRLFNVLQITTTAAVAVLVTRMTVPFAVMALKVVAVVLMVVHGSIANWIFLGNQASIVNYLVVAGLHV